MEEYMVEQALGIPISWPEPVKRRFQFEHYPQVGEKTEVTMRGEFRPQRMYAEVGIGKLELNDMLAAERYHCTQLKYMRS